MAIGNPEVRAAEEVVLQIVADLDGPVYADDITKVAVARDHDAFDVFSAIWFLIDRGRLRLTNDLKVEAPVAR